jgi:carboxymethylenebutenolidase
MTEFDHLKSLFPGALPISRRTLVRTSLGAGFCAAISPVWAQVVTTTADGLSTDEVRVRSGDFDVPTYRAMPGSGGPFPIVLVIHEIFGVHEYIKDVCRRWAHLGYFAIAPDLFARQGNASKESDPSRLMSEFVAKTPDSQVSHDLDATMSFARASASTDAGRAAVTGFCWGGRQVWLYAARNPTLNCGVAWYGPLVYKIDADHPINPPDVVEALKAPVLGLYGGMDKAITAQQIEAMRLALAQAGGSSKIIVYPDAGHAFHADYRPSYNKDDAEESWGEATRWLKANGM